MHVEIDSNGYFLCDAPFADGTEGNTAPHTAADNTKPDGMRKARYVGGSWVDEEGGQLDADLAIDNIALIKKKAGEVITTRIPEWKQRNLIARDAELQRKILLGGTLTAEEQAEWDAMQVEWSWVKDVRAASDAAEVAGTLAADVVWPTLPA